MNTQPNIPNSDDEDEIVNYIYKSLNYAKFKISPNNRAVAEKRKNEIKGAMAKRNLLQDNQIVVDDNFVILAGQGRFLAAMELGLPIYYSFAKDMTLADIRRLSDISESWSMKDNFDYWVKFNIPSYLTLETFMEEHPWLNLSNAVKLIGKGNLGGPVFKEVFNSGEFNAGNLLKGMVMADIIRDFGRFVPTLYKNNGFISAMKVVLKDPNYDHKRMMHKMEAHHGLLVKQGKADQYYAILSEIYNKNAREKDRYWFHKPVKKNP